MAFLGPALPQRPGPVQTHLTAQTDTYTRPRDGASFAPPRLPGSPSHPHPHPAPSPSTLQAEELYDQIQSELGVAMSFRERLIPEAVRFFTGEASDDEDEDEEGGDDDDDDGGDDEEEDDDDDDDDEEESKQKKGKGGKGKGGDVAGALPPGNPQECKQQ
jgi:hypothetical protein